MKKIISYILTALFVAGLAAGVYYLYALSQEINGPAPSPGDQPNQLPEGNDQKTPPDDLESPSDNLTPGQNLTDLPLNVSSGISIKYFAKNIPGARVMAFDGLGNVWVSQTQPGTISLITLKDGEVQSQNVIFSGLNNPHGLAFDPDNGTMLYFAEEDKISRVPVYSEASPEKIADLPEGEGHFTRTIAFGPDGRLYVSVGSSCNVCREEDPRRATIYSMNPDGSDFRVFATGLRNSVFFTWHPETHDIWATDNGRDRIGDDIPPDEINIVREGKNYGWPNCFGMNLLDRTFEKDRSCSTYEPSHIDIQAHSAPLGLDFVPAGWPDVYADDLIVAYHGSWNRSVPTGYKLVRMVLDSQGNYSATEDFITGWLRENGTSIGRPVGVFAHEGALYVTDDKLGVIYKIEKTK